MRNYLFFLPVFLWTLLALLLESSGVKAVLNVWLLWLALLMISGVLLQKGRFWGGIIGMFPGIHMIYTSTRQTVPSSSVEGPMGILLLIFFLASAVMVYQKHRKV